ncbi:MAG: ThiF family adenylyltransferase [Acidobacteria bacterium]|nr:ThiF family adenylyltransferase [Acidobacteriota bacterium]
MNERYGRQMLFRAIGAEGQERLSQARVLLIGCGALGASHAESLARAGVGTLRIVDRDFVELTNLQRQVLFDECDAADRVPKAVAAKERIARINSSVSVEAIVADINNSNIGSLLDEVDVVIDGSDNFQVRYLVNDACVKYDVPWIYGAAVSSYGTTMTIRPHKTPCLRCVFPEMPDAGTSPTCDTAGVLMPIVTTISAIETTEAIKLLIGDLDALHGSLMQIDIWANERHNIGLGLPDADCKCCCGGIYEFLDAGEGEFADVLCGRNAVQLAPRAAAGFDLEALAERLQFSTAVTLNGYLLRFTSGGNEITVFRDGRAIVSGTDDITAARTLYDRFIGT